MGRTLTLVTFDRGRESPYYCISFFVSSLFFWRTFPSRLYYSFQAVLFWTTVRDLFSKVGCLILVDLLVRTWVGYSKVSPPARRLAFAEKLIDSSHSGAFCGMYEKYVLLL